MATIRRPAHRAARVAGTLLHAAAVWRWPARIRCHGDLECCQEVDWPNCNGSNHGWHFLRPDAGDPPVPDAGD